MRVITNEKVINRSKKIADILMPAGFLTLTAAVVGNFYLLNPDNINSTLTIAVLGGLVLGLLLWTIGANLNNTYGGSPRMDVSLNRALKGIDRYHTLYHFVSPTPHLLVGPSGMWILIAKPQRGSITYRKGRWRQAGGILVSYLKLFGQDNIGRPDLEIGSEVEDMRKFLKKELPEIEFPDPQVILLFTNPKAEVDATDAPVPTLKLDQLKKFIKKGAKEKGGRLKPEQVDAIRELLEAGFNEAAEEEAGSDDDE